MGQSASSAVRPPTDGLFLTLAAREGNLEVVSLFLKKNPALAWAKSKDDSTAVHYAAERGHVDVLEALLQTMREAAASNTFDPLAKTLNAPNISGQTALMLACQSGQEASVQVLVLNGADVWAVDSTGRSCLHYAAHRGNSKCVRLVLARAAQCMYEDDAGPKLPDKLSFSRLVSMRDSFGRTALHASAWSGDCRGAAALLAAGAELNAQTSTDCYESDLPCNAGTTALHIASIKGHRSMVLLLLQAYVKGSQLDPSITDPRAVLDAYETSPFAIAATIGNEDLKKVLNPRTIIAELIDRIPNTTVADNDNVAAAYSKYAKAFKGMPLSAAIQQLAVSADSRGGQAPVSRVDEVPPYLMCPLSKTLLQQPVSAADGFTYNEEPLREWFNNGNHVSPVTQQPMQPEFWPNNLLVLILQDWRQGKLQWSTC